MKRGIINKLIVLTLAVVIFVTGAGVTIIDYCCSDCRVEAFFIDGKNCCSIHQHTAKDHFADCCDIHKDLEKSSSLGFSEAASHHCSTSRISVDIDSSVSRPFITSPVIWISDNPFIHKCTLACVEACPCVCEHMDISITPTPRTYLSFIQVLII